MERSIKACGKPSVGDYYDQNLASMKTKVALFEGHNPKITAWPIVELVNALAFRPVLHSRVVVKERLAECVHGILHALVPALAIREVAWVCHIDASAEEGAVGVSLDVGGAKPKI